jgi:hypothetical protein
VGLYFATVISLCVKHLSQDSVILGSQVSLHAFLRPLDLRVHGILYRLSYSGFCLVAVRPKGDLG